MYPERVQQILDNSKKYGKYTNRPDWVWLGYHGFKPIYRSKLGNTYKVGSPSADYTYMLKGIIDELTNNASICSKEYMEAEKFLTQDK